MCRKVDATPKTTPKKIRDLLSTLPPKTPLAVFSVLAANLPPVGPLSCIRKTENGRAVVSTV